MKLAELAGSLAVAMDESIAEIRWINQQTRVLSLNAQIEAARAGDSNGAAFGVVGGARETSRKQPRRLRARWPNKSGAPSRSWNRSAALGTYGARFRFSDSALTNIDLIDRNLYERSCDVRWWATDASLVIACTDLGDNALLKRRDGWESSSIPTPFIMTWSSAT